MMIIRNYISLKLSIKHRFHYLQVYTHLQLTHLVVQQIRILGREPSGSHYKLSCLWFWFGRHIGRTHSPSIKPKQLSSAALRSYSKSNSSSSIKLSSKASRRMILASLNEVITILVCLILISSLQLQDSNAYFQCQNEVIAVCRNGFFLRFKHERNM